MFEILLHKWQTVHLIRHYFDWSKTGFQTHWFHVTCTTPIRQQVTSWKMRAYRNIFYQNYFKMFFWQISFWWSYILWFVTVGKLYNYWYTVDSLSRPRSSRITAYLEVKIWSLPIHENLTTDGKYCRKEKKLLLRSNFSSFPQYFQYISNFKSPITFQFVKCG